MKNTTGILALFAVVLYVSGFQICEHFYYDDIDSWRFLRDTLTGISIFLLVLVGLLPKSRLSIASLWALLVFCFGNIVDRLVFDIDGFVYSDWFLITIAIMIFIYKLKGHAKNTRRYLSDTN